MCMSWQEPRPYYNEGLQSRQADFHCQSNFSFLPLTDTCPNTKTSKTLRYFFVLVPIALYGTDSRCKPKLASNSQPSYLNLLSAGIIGMDHPAKLTDPWGTACHTVLVLFWLPSHLFQSWHIFMCIIYVCMYYICVYIWTCTDVCSYVCITSVKSLPTTTCP